MITALPLIDPQKSLRDILGKAENREKYRDDPIYREYQKQLVTLHTLGDIYKIDLGEILLLINRLYGLSWDTIPLCKFDEIALIIKKNWYCILAIIEPEFHNRLMETENEYSKWYTYQESTHNAPRRTDFGNDD
jgi:hypothetical protein